MLSDPNKSCRSWIKKDSRTHIGQIRSIFGTKRSQVQILSPRPKFCLKITIFGLFCCLILLDFFSEIHRYLIKPGFQRTCSLSDSIGWQLIKGDLWNCASGFGAPFRSGMFIDRSGRKRAVSTRSNLTARLPKIINYYRLLTFIVFGLAYSKGRSIHSLFFLFVYSLNSYSAHSQRRFDAKSSIRRKAIQRLKHLHQRFWQACFQNEASRKAWDNTSYLLWFHPSIQFWPWYLNPAGVSSSGSREGCYAPTDKGDFGRPL